MKRWCRGRRWEQEVKPNEVADPSALQGDEKLAAW